MSSSMLEKLTIVEIRGFRRERIKKIENGETPKPLDNEQKLAKLVLHLIPMRAFAPSMILNLSSLHKDLNALSPIYTSVRNGKYNSEGFRAYGHSVLNEKGSTGSYVQIFHNGIVEAVDLHLLLEQYIRGQLFQQGLIKAVPRFLAKQREIGVEPPLFIMLSLLRVKGFYLYFGKETISDKIDQDDILVPEIQINSTESNPIQVMKPIFDVVWNAVGLAESTSYNQIKT
jgi:hypothetical protein